MTINELNATATTIASGVIKATKMRNNLVAKGDLSEKELVLKKNLEAVIRKLIAQHESLLDQIGYMKRAEREKELRENSMPNGTLAYKPFASLKA
jgi:hypothetical protein